MRSWRWFGIGIGLSAHLGCSGGEQTDTVVLPPDDTTTTSSTSQGVVVGIAAPISIGSTDGGSTTGDPGVDPCKTTECLEGQRCENQAGTAVCIGISCEELACDDTELCVSIDGGGHVCREKC